METDIDREVRAAREALFARFGNDLRALHDYLRELDAAGDWPVVNLGPRRPEGWVPPTAAPPAAKAG
ncbi:MAG: hypothetical protein K2X82_03160 [Gemmataceae bacterium]|nr:hypothetical protein [Gemmataceae bacterium]